jgi:hypothetical protein
MCNLQSFILLWDGTGLAVLEVQVAIKSCIHIFMHRNTSGDTQEAAYLSAGPKNQALFHHFASQ